MNKIDCIADESLVLRKEIDSLEQQMFTLPQIPIETTHHFSKGIYAREIFIPKGTLLTGKIHKTEHLNICSKGEISVMTEDGVKRITAPFIMNCRPGTKRVGYAHEDTVWTTIHGTNETNLSVLENELVVNNYDDLDESLLNDIAKLKESILCLSSQAPLQEAPSSDM